MCSKRRKAEKRYRPLLFLVGFIFHVKTRRKNKKEKRFLYSARRQGSGGAPSNISYIDICNRLTILFSYIHDIRKKFADTESAINNATAMVVTTGVLMSIGMLGNWL
jgi:hypothetical protein